MKCHLLFGKVLVFFYYYLLLCRLLSSASGQVVASEKSILLEFKRSVSDPSGILSNWVSNSSSSNHCSWFGVSCDSNFRVSSLNITFISGKRGKYQAPTCSSKLSQFPYEGFGIRRVCSLSGKKLVGKLSPLIGNLTQLRVLSLPCNELCGEIPPEIFGLEKLEVLDLEGNLLNGKLIENFSGLRWLKVLNLGFNSIYGEIPDSLSKCTSLRILNLAGNQVNGSIPQFFSNFSRLEGLYLSQNRLTDYLPAQFGEGFQNLEHLDLSGNFLFGPIPSSLGNSLQLRTLLLFLNNFDDVIPPEFGRLQMLEVLDVSRNSLSGLIPAELGRCHKLSVLVLSNLYSTLLTKQNSSEEDPFIESLGDFRDEYNYFKGTIPDEITSLPNLRILWAPRSTLAGGLSSNWADCESLEMLNLAQNLLTGEIIGVFERCKNLHYLDLSSNRLTGKLDEKLPIPCIPFFDIGNNLISGPIPSYNYSSCPHRPSFKLHRLGIYNPEDAYLSFFTCQSRLIMDLPFTGNSFSVMHNFGSNNLSGSIQSLPIPLKMLGSRADYAFLADGNKLSGSFPGRLLERCDELKGMIANVSYNDLSGHIPFDVGTKCRSLRFMDASYNQISGSIPPSFGDFESLVVLDLSGNKLQGVIPNEVSRLKNLKYLSLASNGLTGSIPSSFTWLRSLQVLELSSNNISGEIPQGLVYLRRLTTLQLKNNKLSGKIPSGLANLKSLSSFNVSFNNLSGSIPLNYNNAMNCSSFLGNPFLYSCHIVSLTVPSPNLPDDYEGDSRDNKSSPSGSNSKRRIKGLTSIEIASIISASVIASVLLALVILFFYTRKWVPDSRIQVSESREITVFTDIGVQLTFDSIVRSTGNFSASNCIGNGGFGATYKAEISPGTIVAVKRLSVGRFQGVQQFHAEIKTLGRVRNPNLVTLIGYHASDTEMFLIYNYLPGGNLENFIKERLTRAVDWKILHKIALDIARALAYLHDQCVPRVLHRDVKPSNILLDNEFNAYLSDFGLSRLLGTSETHATTGVAGTFGYVAPEYAMTCRVSEKADVYSYGVVLLELISDKKALDPSFSSHGNGFNIVSWACMQLRLGKANEVFTAGLWDVAPHDDLVQVLHLAVTCTVETLSTRPTMRQVVQRLKQVQPC